MGTSVEESEVARDVNWDSPEISMLGCIVQSAVTVHVTVYNLAWGTISLSFVAFEGWIEARVESLTKKASYRTNMELK